MSGIYTKLHEIQAAAQHLPKDGQTRAFVEAITDVPHFVYDTVISQKLDRTALIKSMGALQTAGMLRLPYPRMLYELWEGNPAQRIFGLLEERGEVGSFRLWFAQWSRDDTGDYLTEPMVVDLEWSDRAPPDSTTLLHSDGTETDPKDDEPGWGWTCRWDDDVIDRNRTILIPLGFAAMLSVMMSHVSGFVRETVEPRKLNKARAANGKHAIPTHTVLRIGHVYDSSGAKVKVTGTGGTMPIHMRAAHTRRQHYGKGNELTKLVFIEAVLVNYVDGTDLAKPLPKVVKL